MAARRRSAASSCRSSAAARCSWTCTCSGTPTEIAEDLPLSGVVELREEVTPAGPFRLPWWNGMDGLTRRRSGVLERLLHHGELPVVVRVAQPAPARVLFGARAASGEAAAYGIARMRFALGVDEDLRAFHRRFAHDPLIGSSLRRRPWLRVGRRPEPFEALAWAICEQLIEYERAATIQRRMVAALGRRCPGWDGPGTADGGQRPWSLDVLPLIVTAHEWERIGRGLRQRARLLNAVGTDLYGPQTLLRDGLVPPALLESFDLAGARARTLVRAAREVAGGRVDLHGSEHERGWRRLRAIPGIGPWTVEMLALRGQGRHDQVPAGDLGLLKLAGRLLSGGDPRAVASEGEVRELFAPYGEWGGLAAAHMLAP